MYNGNQIETFMKKVQQEAEKAAQDVFDKYQPELEERIKSQMQPNDVLVIGMGAASLSRKGFDKPFGYADHFENVVASTQYACLTANFVLNDISK